MQIYVKAKGSWNGEVRFYIDDNGNEQVITLSPIKGNPLKSVLLDWHRIYYYRVPEECYSLMLTYGGIKAKEYLVKFIGTKYRDIKDIVPLKYNNRWILYIVGEKYSLPYYVMGDGFKNTLVYLMLLSSIHNTILLLEEPELHQHPSLLELVATAVVTSSIKSKNQIFISTHSLEFTDMIIKELESYNALNKLNVYRFNLENGILSTVNYSGVEARDARRELEYDLRG